MNAVERTAEVIHVTRHEVGSIDSHGAAEALNDVGLLRPDWATDEAKAVLDAIAADQGIQSNWLTRDERQRAELAYVASLGGPS